MMTLELVRFFRSSRAKLTFLWLSIFMNGLLMCLLPFQSSFAVLVILRLVQNFALGSYITADAAMYVYTMGPIRSRPFTNALHAAVGVGFFLSSWVTRPFLPEDDKSLLDRDEICNKSAAAVETSPGDGPQEDLASVGGQILWPFLISGLYCVVMSLGYLALGT